MLLMSGNRLSCNMSLTVRESGNAEFPAVRIQEVIIVGRCIQAKRLTKNKVAFIWLPAYGHEGSYAFSVPSRRARNSLVK